MPQDATFDEDDILDLTDIVEKGSAAQAGDDFSLDEGDVDASFEKELEDLFSDNGNADSSGKRDGAEPLLGEDDFDALLGAEGDEGHDVPLQVSDSGGDDMDLSEFDDILGGDEDRGASASGGGIDVSEFEALLGGEAPPPKAAAQASADDFDISDIDALLDSGGEAPPPKAAAQASAEGFDISDIDALLAEGGEEEPADVDFAALLAEGGEGEEEPADVDFAALLAEGQEPEAGEMAVEEEESEDFGVADLGALLGEGAQRATPPVEEESEAVTLDELDELDAEGEVQPTAAYPTPDIGEDIDLSGLNDLLQQDLDEELVEVGGQPMEPMSVILDEAGEFGPGEAAMEDFDFSELEEAKPPASAGASSASASPSVRELDFSGLESAASLAPVEGEEDLGGVADIEEEASYAGLDVLIAGLEFPEVCEGQADMRRERGEDAMESAVSAGVGPSRIEGKTEPAPSRRREFDFDLVGGQEAETPGPVQAALEPELFPLPAAAVSDLRESHDLLQRSMEDAQSNVQALYERIGDLEGELARLSDKALEVSDVDSRIEQALERALSGERQAIADELESRLVKVLENRLPKAPPGLDESRVRDLLDERLAEVLEAEPQPDVEELEKRVERQVMEGRAGIERHLEQRLLEGLAGLEQTVDDRLASLPVAPDAKDIATRVEASLMDRLADKLRSVEGKLASLAAAPDAEEVSTMIETRVAEKLAAARESLVEDVAERLERTLASRADKAAAEAAARIIREEIVPLLAMVDDEEER